MAKPPCENMARSFSHRNTRMEEEEVGQERRNQKQTMNDSHWLPKQRRSGPEVTTYLHQNNNLHYTDFPHHYQQNHRQSRVQRRVSISLIQVTTLAVLVILLQANFSVGAKVPGNQDSVASAVTPIDSSTIANQRQTITTTDNHKVLKRSPEQEKMRYNFGLGKRYSDQIDLYELGNKPPGSVGQDSIDPETQLVKVRTLMQLLKNYQKKFSPDADTKYDDHQLVGNSQPRFYHIPHQSNSNSRLIRESAQKRQPSGQSSQRQFAFGLGRKRTAELIQNSDNYNDEPLAPSVKGDEEIEHEINSLETPSSIVGANRAEKENAENNENETNENDESDDESLEKRKGNRYEFGLGKRFRYLPGGSPGTLVFHSVRGGSGGRITNNFEDFMKRRYSFGLGK